MQAVGVSSFVSHEFGSLPAVFCLFAVQMLYQPLYHFNADGLLTERPFLPFESEASKHQKPSHYGF